MKERLVQMGHNVLATWLEEVVRPDGIDEVEFERKMAMKDLQEVAASDCVILDMASPSRTSGKMIETGFALAKHKLLYVVGEKPDHSIFLLLADRHFKDWDELFAYFEKRHPAIKVTAEQLTDKYLIDKPVVKKAK